MLVDARKIVVGKEFTCDLCVIGAGPAGIALVDRLRDSGLSIMLLESGGFDPEVASQRLFQGEIEGDDYFRLDTCRFRLFGGSTNRWGGWCRPLDKVDFEQRDWLPWSGWPITEKNVEPYYSDAAKLLELPHSRFDLATWQESLPAPFALDGSNFENILFQFSPGTNFGEAYRARLIAASNVITVLHANLTEMRLAPGSKRIECLQVATLTGRKFSIRPRAVVLAAGGIENARLLLASRIDRSAGLGNEFDLVGRFFMEHLHVPAGHMLPGPSANNRSLYRQPNLHRTKVCGLIVPTVAAMERHKLPATSIAIEAASYQFGTLYLNWPSQVTYGPVRLYRKLRTGSLRPFAESIRLNVERASYLPKRYRTWRAASAARRRAEVRADAGPIYSLYFRAEQAPDPENRVALIESRDALGVPKIRLDWRVKSVDTEAISAWLKVFDRDMRTRGIGRVIPPPDGWTHEIIGGPHHMGTTRMSADPRHGVVDGDCRVHSVDNLYVAGSSVFTTGGYANPTFTLVALALRLADTLRNRLRHAVELGADPENASTSGSK